MDYWLPSIQAIKKIGSSTLNSRRRQIAKHHIKIYSLFYLTAFCQEASIWEISETTNNNKMREKEGKSSKKQNKKRQTIIKSQNN